MKKSLFAVLMCATAISLSALELIDNLPFGTKFFGRLDMKLLRENQIYQKLNQENKEQVNFISAIFALMSGINIDDIDAVYLATKGENDGFIVLEGSFDTTRIQQILAMNGKNQAIKEENAIFAIEIPDNRRAGEKNLAVIIDDKTLAIGQVERVREFLSVIAGKGETLSSKKADELKKIYLQKNTFQFSLIELTDEMLENPVLRNILSADISAELTNGMNIKMKLLMTDPEIAKASEQILSGLVVFLKRINISKFTPDKAAEILKDEILQSFTVVSKDDEVLVNAHISENSLENIIRAQIAKVNPSKQISKPKENKDKDVFQESDDEKSENKSEATETK